MTDQKANCRIVVPARIAISTTAARVIHMEQESIVKTNSELRKGGPPVARQTATATTQSPAPETATLKALVTLTVAPKEGQVPEEATANMLALFTDYITGQEGSFLTDYGTTPEDLQKYRLSNNDPSEQPTWGGYDGPFVLESKVEAIA